MENFMKKYLRKQQGITLIALVITIIVLLILAGVTIATLTGDNGLLNKAEQAKEKTLEGEIDEQKKLAQTEAIMNIEETEYNGVKIPAYCAPTRIEGESTIDEGLVIIDKNGNEWVWIEVPKTATVYPTAGLGITNFTEEECDQIYNDLKTYTADYKSSYTDEWYDGNGKTESESTNLNDKTGCGLTSEEYKTLKNKMLKSVYENGGFYIGKYEVGTDTTRYNKTDELTKPLIQEDKYPYNYVTCSQAQELSQQLATGGRESSLMFGVQWDLVLKYIETKGGKTQSELKTDSSSWGNYNNVTFPITKGKYSTDYGKTFTEVNRRYTKPKDTSVLLTTGATERNSVLNIYDLAGNVYAWTLEKSTVSDNPCMLRGGNYNGNGSYLVASCRNSYSASNGGYYSAFRPALY